jgi:hypothetical protein
MAKNMQSNEGDANEAQPQRVDSPKRKSAAREGDKQHIYITAHVKYNGTFYSDTVVEVDSAIARKLIEDGSAREATQDEIDEANERIEDQRTPITEKVESLRALGIEQAVDSNGRPIPNSLITRETKLRNSEGNTLEGAPVNEADELEEDENPTMATEPGTANAASANPPDTSKANKGARKI